MVAPSIATGVNGAWIFHVALTVVRTWPGKKHEKEHDAYHEQEYTNTTRYDSTGVCKPSIKVTNSPIMCMQPYKFACSTNVHLERSTQFIYRHVNELYFL